MFEQKLCDQAKAMVARFFPEWIELADDQLAEFLKDAPDDGGFNRFSPEKLFAAFITRVYMEKKGAKFDSLEEVNKEIHEYLGAVDGSDLSDEEIRWELIDKLGDIE